MSLDDAIDKWDANVIKIDAEGAEFPALYTCTKLDQIETIFGEFHNVVGTVGMGKILFDEETPEFLQDFKGRLSMVKLAEFLKEQGFLCFMSTLVLILACSGPLNPLTVCWLSPSKLEEVSCYCYES